MLPPRCPGGRQRGSRLAAAAGLLFGLLGAIPVAAAAPKPTPTPSSPSTPAATPSAAGQAPRQALFRTRAEAEAAAKHFHCSGAHQMGQQWMPCASHGQASGSHPQH